MKKLLAMLLALIMALGCVGAFAETDQEEPSAQFNLTDIMNVIPAFTITSESNLNVDAVKALMSTTVPQEQAGMMDMVLPLLANLTETVIFANGGAQLDLSAKGQQLVSLACEAQEDGFALGSDIIPSIVLKVSNEDIENLIKQFTEQFSSLANGIDFNSLMTSVTPYFTEAATAIQSAITAGEPVMGEYEVEGITFNKMIPYTVDVEALAAATNNLKNKLLADEQVQSVLAALKGFVTLPDVDEEITLPASLNMTAEQYVIVDEEGYETGVPTYTAVYITKEGEEDQTVNMGVLVSETLKAVVEIPQQDAKIAVVFSTKDNGYIATAEIIAQQNYIGIESTTEFDENGFRSDSEVYFNDTETPIATESVVFAQGGERTLSLDAEGKTVINALQLFADQTGEAMGALMTDLQTNGLSNLLNKAMQVYPDEVTNLMSLMSGAPEDEAQ